MQCILLNTLVKRYTIYQWCKVRCSTISFLIIFEISSSWFNLKKDFNFHEKNGTSTANNNKQFCALSQFAALEHKVISRLEGWFMSKDVRLELILFQVWMVALYRILFKQRSRSAQPFLQRFNILVQFYGSIFCSFILRDTTDYDVKRNILIQTVGDVWYFKT